MDMSDVQRGAELSQAIAIAESKRYPTTAHGLPAYWRAADNGTVSGQIARNRCADELEAALAQGGEPIGFRYRVCPEHLRHRPWEGKGIVTEYGKPLPPPSDIIECQSVYLAPPAAPGLVEALRQSFKLAEGGSFNSASDMADWLRDDPDVRAALRQSGEAVAWNDDAAWALARKAEIAGAERDSDDNETWWVLKIEHFNALATPPATSGLIVTDAMIDQGLQAARIASNARLPRYSVIRAFLTAALAAPDKE